MGGEEGKGTDDGRQSGMKCGNWLLKIDEIMRAWGFVGRRTRFKRFGTMD